MSTKLIAVAAVALATLVGGVAYATIPDGSGIIHACYTKSGGVLRVIDSSSASCGAKETALDWNRQGPPGPQGLEGEPGPSNAYYTTEPEQRPLPDTVGQHETIALLRDLPAGSYVFDAHTTAADPGTFTAVRCGIRAAGQDSFGKWGSAAALGLNGPGSSWFAQAFVSLAVTSHEPFDADFYCLTTTPSTTAYVEQSSLYGTKVGSLEVRPNAAP